MNSTKLTYGVDVISAETNLGDFVDSLKGKNSWLGGVSDNTIYFHATDHLKLALETLRKGRVGDPEFRIVIFIDDLDRCTPEKALQVIESIKSFFDIEGIIYVLGMNYNTINEIIKTKYGRENPTVGGYEYMQKIVHLPFQIPIWGKDDILEFVHDLLSKHLEGSKQLVNEFKNNEDLIVSAVKENPREAKRFINDILFTTSIFEHLDIDKLIVVRAMIFRHEWNDFLEFIRPDEFRKQFLKRYLVHFEQYELRAKIEEVNPSFYENNESPENLDEFKDRITIVYQPFFEKDNPLINFLNGRPIILLSMIPNIGIYIKALEAVTFLKKVTEADLELEYSGWRYEEKDKEYNKKMYGFHVRIKAANSILNRIDFVTYRLPAWPIPLERLQKNPLNLD